MSLVQPSGLPDTMTDVTESADHAPAPARGISQTPPLIAISHHHLEEPTHRTITGVGYHSVEVGEAMRTPSEAARVVALVAASIIRTACSSGVAAGTDPDELIKQAALDIDEGALVEAMAHFGGDMF